MDDKMHMNWSARSIGAILLGNIVYALTVKLFLLPASLASGGATGIALAAHYATGVSVSGILLIVNVSMLLLGLFALGKSFVVTTLLSTFLIPAALEVADRVLGEFVLTEDILLCTLFAGLGVPGDRHTDRRLHRWNGYSAAGFVQVFPGTGVGEPLCF